nr:uncharacterized protein LOC109161280 [Ipomoea batatas]
MGSRKNVVSKHNTDSDEWGFIYLKEKFAELGYKEGNFRFFSVVEDCLVELLSDSETLNVANSLIRPQLVEVWVVQSSSAEYEEDEIIEEGYIGESEDELVSVDEESSANEYEEDNVDNLEVELGDVNDEVNLSDERPIPGSDGEVESNKRNMEPEIEAQREGQAGMVADIAENGIDQAGRVDDNDGNAQIEADIAENAHTEMQEEIPIHTQPDFEYETQVDSGNTSLFEIPVDSDQSLIEGLAEQASLDMNMGSSSVTVKLGATSTRTIAQQNKGMLLMKSKGKKKGFGTTKEEDHHEKKVLHKIKSEV